jgi:hypothetical protein
MRFFIIFYTLIFLLTVFSACIVNTLNKIKKLNIIVSSRYEAIEVYRVGLTRIGSQTSLLSKRQVNF